MTKGRIVRQIRPSFNRKMHQIDKLCQLAIINQMIVHSPCQAWCNNLVKSSSVASFDYK